MYRVQGIEVGWLSTLARLYPDQPWTGSLVAYLISNLAAPFSHFGDSLLVHLSTGLLDGLDDREIGLERIERRDSVLGAC